MKQEGLRDESTEDGRKIWQDVDRVASDAPDWVVARLCAGNEVAARSDSAKTSGNHSQSPSGGGPDRPV